MGNVWELKYLPPFLTLALVAVTTAFSRFQVHSVRDDVLQLHQFQLDRICAAESGGRRRSLVVDDDVGGRRRWGGARPIVVAAAAARG